MRIPSADIFMTALTEYAKCRTFEKPKMWSEFSLLDIRLFNNEQYSFIPNKHILGMSKRLEFSEMVSAYRAYCGKAGLSVTNVLRMPLFIHIGK